MLFEPLPQGETLIRRLIAAAGIAAVVLGLGACRSNPDVAAYVGDVEISEKYVTELADEVGGEAKRGQIVQLLVIRELCLQQVAAEGGTAPAPQAQDGAPKLAVLSEQLRSCLGTIKIEQVVPTDGDWADVCARAVKAGLFGPGATVESSMADCRSEQNKATVEGAFGLKASLDKANSTFDVRVNPRYAPLTMPLISVQNASILDAVLGSQSAIISQNS